MDTAEEESVAAAVAVRCRRRPLKETAVLNDRGGMRGKKQWRSGIIAVVVVREIVGIGISRFVGLKIWGKIYQSYSVV